MKIFEYVSNVATLFTVIVRYGPLTINIVPGLAVRYNELVQRPTLLIEIVFAASMVVVSLAAPEFAARFAMLAAIISIEVNSFCTFVVVAVVVVVGGVVTLFNDC